MFPMSDSLADLGAALDVLENFCTEVGKPQIPRRPLEQPDAELILQLGLPPGDC